MSFRGSRILPVSADEFARMFSKCMPPSGWQNNIGVANSGGPDSSCLLFLIRRYLAGKKPERPQRVFSFTVDHALQPASVAMAEHCSQFAQKLGVEHVTSKVHWGEDPYPPLPLAGQPFESAARIARYQALFKAMTEKDANVLAFGHHLDDQVETSLIRLSWGSTAVGAGGMKPCRRWGMGKNVGVGSEYGFRGMNRWIVRPMLNVTKDRILATCEANNIEYVTDLTNFEPAITLRNAIRHEIQARKNPKPSMPSSTLPGEIVERLTMLKTTAKRLPKVSMSLDSSIDELRNSVLALNRQAQDLDDQVDSALKRCSLPTFPGTFLFSKKGLNQIDDPEVRRSLVLRVVRHVSPYPWGSIAADAGRRKGATDEIIKQLWTTLTRESRLRPFTAGGGVLWTPAIVRSTMIQTPEAVINPLLLENDVLGWLASRLPPLNREKLTSRNLPNTLEINVTQTILDAYQRWRNGGGPSTVPVLWDSRFLVQFNLDKIPQDVLSRLNEETTSKNRLMLLSASRWYLPKVAIDSDGVLGTLHNRISDQSKSALIAIPPMRHWRRSRRHELEEETIDSGWIIIEWIRPLTAL